MTKLEICNNALLRVGQRPLQSLDEDSADSRLVNILLEPAVEEVLRESVWSAALKRASLVLSPDTPLFGYDYSFYLPSDMIRLVEVYDSNGDPDNIFWKIEGDKLLTDAEEVNLTYLHVPEDLDKLDSLLSQAIVLRLALKLAYPKTESKTLVESLILEYEQVMITKAKSVDALENHEESRFGEIEWIESRNWNW